MRELILSDRPEHLRENYVAELQIYTIYPEDCASRQQALFLLNHEWERWKSKPGSEYRPSGLVSTLLKSFRKTTPSRFTCGTLAIAMCALENAGQNPTEEAASNVIYEFNNVEDKLPFTFWDDGEWVDNLSRLISDRKQILQSFRRYRSISHILAAWVVASEYIEPLQPFDSSPEADICFLHTVLYFQNRLRNFPNFENWNLWEVRVSPPYNPADYPVFEISDELISWLLRPWLDSRNS